MKAIIVGGGIGGLSLALSLHQIGFDPYVFESAPAFQFLGLGINVQPHAVRELTELGLGEHSRTIPSRPPSLPTSTSTGN